MQLYYHTIVTDSSRCSNKIAIDLHLYYHLMCHDLKKKESFNTTSLFFCQDKNFEKSAFIVFAD